ncbi:MAG: glycine cleavage system protein GcvH [Candidatus Thermoplasmatota archaeon]|nr:glycine cleavage system protein GcvH [Candidatus Thermoplasmatota archaeon]
MSNEVREDLKYTDTHEWVKIKDDTAIIGITDHAQSELTDIVFAELPEVGKKVVKGDELCVVESVKSVSEIYTPLTGVVKKVNTALEDAPETINQSPYDKGWLVEIKLENIDETNSLHDAESYRKLL